MEAVQASINADIINIKDADIEMDEYGEEEHRGASSQARRALAGEDLGTSSMNPLVGRYGSTQSMRKSSQAKPSQGTEMREMNLLPRRKIKKFRAIEVEQP